MSPVRYTIYDADYVAAIGAPPFEPAASSTLFLAEMAATRCARLRRARDLRD